MRTKCRLGCIEACQHLDDCVLQKVILPRYASPPDPARLLLMVWYQNGDPVLFDAPGAVPIEVARRLIVEHGGAKIARVEFCDPIASAANAGSKPVRIVGIGPQMKANWIEWKIDDSNLPKVRQGNSPVPGAG